MFYVIVVNKFLSYLYTYSKIEILYTETIKFRNHLDQSNEPSISLRKGGRLFKIMYVLVLRNFLGSPYYNFIIIGFFC